MKKFIHDSHGDGSPDTNGSVDMHFIGRTLHVWKSHTGSETKIQDLFTGGGISLLHSKRHIRDSGTVIRQHHDNFIRKDIYVDDTTVCMDYHIDFSFIHGNGTAADDICIQVH